MPRSIELVPLSRLLEWPANPKTHAGPELEASIRRHGFRVPPAIDGRTGLLAAGHGRRAALARMREAGEAPPAGISVDPASGDWLVPVLVGWSSASDAEAAAYAIADNRLCESGGWDASALSSVLAPLALLGDAGLAGVGFSAEDVARLARDAAEAREEADARARADAARRGAPGPDGAPPSYRCPKCGRAWAGSPRPGRAPSPPAPPPPEATA